MPDGNPLRCRRKKQILKTIIFSSFNSIDLSRSMLANCCMWRCQEEGTRATVGR
jgi:hypothetical protein